MRNWTKEFNALPANSRLIASAVGMEGQINGLKRERERLTQRYKQSQKEITGHIKNIERVIKALEE